MAGCRCTCRCRCLDACSFRVTRWLENRFQSLGEFIATYPIHLLIVSFIVCLVLASGMSTLSIENDTETLYTPVGSQASLDRVRYQAVFPDRTASNYSRHTLTKLDIFGEVIFYAPNVLDNAALVEIQSHVEAIKNINVTFNDNTYSLSDVCAKNSGACSISGEFVTRPDFVTDSLNGAVTYPVWKTIDISSIFASVNVSGGNLVSAEYLKVTFHLRQDTDTSQARSAAWEDEFLNQVPKLSFSNVALLYATSESLNQELNSNTNGDIKFFSITFTLMITYATLVAGGDVVSSRTWASCAGVLAAGMGIISAFGLVSMFNVKFVSLVGVTPFLILGIGVDDMFLLMSSWQDTYVLETSLQNRMGRTFALAGIGITITSITDLLAFVIGASSVFISVRNFCLYTGVAVIATYLYQLFVFGSCLALHGRRVDDNRHCMTCLRVPTRHSLIEEGHSKCYSYCCGGQAPTQQGQDERFFESLPRKYLPKILLSVPGTIIICVLYVVYFGISIWGITNLKQGLDLKNLALQTSYYYSYRDTLDTHFDSSFPIPFVFESSTVYTDSDTVTNINNLLTNAGSDENVNSASTICWLFAYRTSSVYDASNFIVGLKTFLSASSNFDNDVEFSADGNSIVASRCYMFSTNIKDSNTQAAVMERMRQLAADSGLDVYVFHPAFIFFEQYLAILPSTLQTVGIALVVMTVITFIFLPNPLLVILVIFNIISILLGIFGFLFFWDLSLSSITMIHLIMSVGFSVDFSVHVCSAYLLNDSETRYKRARFAIEHAASPILNGALSSFLGVVVLAASQSFIFQSFFKVMFTVVLFGMLHAVCVLPLVLSIVGPNTSDGQPSCTCILHVPTGGTSQVTPTEGDTSQEASTTEGDTSQEARTTEGGPSQVAPTTEGDTSQEARTTEGDTSQEARTTGGGPSQVVPTEGGTSQEARTTEGGPSQVAPTEGDTLQEAPTTEGDTSQEARTTEGGPSQVAPTTEGDTSQEARTTEGDTSQEAPTTEGDTSQEARTTEGGPSQVAPTEGDTSQEARITEGDTSQEERTTEGGPSQVAPTEGEPSHEARITEGEPSHEAPPTKGEPSKKAPPTKGEPSQKAPPTKGEPSQKESTTEGGISQKSQTTTSSSPTRNSSRPQPRPSSPQKPQPRPSTSKSAYNVKPTPLGQKSRPKTASSSKKSQSIPSSPQKSLVILSQSPYNEKLTKH